ncbi:hypothetical protein B0A55_10647 [Friedmanniomyces simplex]|uniref:Uncharacterized protein n=1 Tax=Friedmanniomyces simplex TaxID=329884 RepID=A0A4U0WJE0_9PEZI|nr:hypothetical protein B0A55_10647 [Friedmanniomyces simplex]
MFSTTASRAPPTIRKVKKRPQYYEDIYGTENADEAFDRFPDDCESEPDSGNDMEASPSTRAKAAGFFNSYAPQSKQQDSSQSEDEDETPPPDKAGAVRGIFGNVNLPYHNNNKTPDTSKSRPNLFQKKHVPFTTTSSPKKLTPKKKFGMFGTAPLTPDTGTTTERIDNSDALTFDDASMGNRNSGNATNADRLLDGQPGEFDPTTSTGAFPANDLSHEMETSLARFQPANDIPTDSYNYDAGFDPSDFTNHAKDGAGQGHDATEPGFTAPSTQMLGSNADGTQNATADDAIVRSSPMPGMFPEEAEPVAEKSAMEEDETGYQADDDDTLDQIQIPGPKRRGRPSKTAISSKQHADEEEAPRRARSATIKQVEAEEAEKIANRLRKRRSLPAQPTRVSLRNKKATARTATLRKKTKKVVVPVTNGISSKRAWQVSRESSRLGGLRNWKGERLEGKGKGYVEVTADDVDRDEYVKYY